MTRDHACSLSSKATPLVRQVRQTYPPVPWQTFAYLGALFGGKLAAKNEVSRLLFCVCACACARCGLSSAYIKQVPQRIEEENDQFQTQGNGKVCEFMHCKVVLLKSWRTKLRVYATLESSRLVD